MSHVRATALRLIQAIDGGQTAQAALASCSIDKAQRQFCSDLVYGVLRTRIRLQQELKPFLHKPEKLPEPMRILLEMAVYSCLFQNRAHKHAVCNDTVNLVKKKFGSALGNVANGVLRAFLRTSHVPSPPHSLRQWARFYAIPYEIAALWAAAYGEEAAVSLMKRSFERPFTGLRINQRRFPELREALLQLPGAETVGANGVAFSPGQLPEKILDKPLPCWQKLGALTWQAAGSQAALNELGLGDVWRDKPVWDACAGFGGKTTALLEEGVAVELATDTHMGRLKLLAKECGRLHLRSPAILRADAACPPLLRWGGHILADIPCSGLGVLARRPDIKAKWQPLAELEKLQISILKGLATALQPGGELAIITCTLNPAENENWVNWLEHAGFTLVKQWQTPHDHPWLEGMFAARLVKKNNSQTPF